MATVLKTVDSVRDEVGEEEWAIRVDLAAAYRLVAHYGWDDLIFTHLSARVPGPEHHFLINPYNLMFEEITASSLVKIDVEGRPVMPTPYLTNPAGFTIHSALHMARDDANAVMHLHTPAGQAVAAQAEGLMPLTQTAMLVRDEVAYHDFEGVALDLDERERLVADMGDKGAMILRNHGTLTVGANVAQCFIKMYFLERACEAQIMALSGGVANLYHPEPGDAREDARAGQERPRRHRRQARVAGAAAQDGPARPRLPHLSAFAAPALADSGDDKPAFYRDLAAALDGLLGDEPDAIANAANTAALIFATVPDLNWAGFYFLKGGELVVGPFQGQPACVRIAMGRGVCGTAAAERRTVVVADVHAFPGHIACDAASRSELVVPLVARR